MNHCSALLLFVSCVVTSLEKADSSMIRPLCSPASLHPPPLPIGSIMPKLASYSKAALAGRQTVAKFRGDGPPEAVRLYLVNVR